MSLKAKLISSISAFVLVLTILIVSVWAVSQTQIPIGGTVNFKATNVHAEVSGTVTGMEDNPTLPTLIFSEREEDASSEEDLSPWKNLNLLFTELGEPIKITITVKNLSDERSLGVSITNQMAPIENVNISITKGEGEASTSAIVSPSSSATFVLTISVEDINVSVKDALYKFLINLTDASQMREINVHSNYPENITLSGGGMYAVGDTVTITASPDDSHAALYIASDPNFKNIIDVSQNAPFLGGLQPYSYTFTLEEDSLTDYYFVAADFAESAQGDTVTGYVEGYGEFVPVSGQPTPQKTGNFYYILKDAKVAFYFGLYASGSEEENLAITSVTALEEVVFDDVAYPVVGIASGDTEFFRDCPNVTEIILPSSIRVVWNNIFFGINIKNLQFAGNEFLRYDEENKVFLNDENVIVGAFANSTVPEEATGTIEYAFRSYGGTELVFGPSFKSLGERTFGNSKNLTTITFEGALEEIGKSAFYGCDNLTTIILGAGSTANQTFEEVGLSGTWTKDGSIVTSFSGEGNYVKPIKSYSGVNYSNDASGSREYNLEFNIFSDMTAQFKMIGNQDSEELQIIARGEVEMLNGNARITKPTYLYAEGVEEGDPIVWQEGDSENLENTAYLYALTYTQAMMIMDKVIYIGELSCFVDGYKPQGTDAIIGASFTPALELTGEETLSEIFEGSNKPSLGIFFDRYKNYGEYGDEVDCNFQPKNLIIKSFDGKPYDGATKVTLGLHTVEVSFQLEENGETLTTTALFNASNLPNVI